MSILIEPYTAERVEAVSAFNRRLKAGGCPYAFPEHSVSTWLPPASGERLFEDFFLAVESEEVRGAYVLKQQPFWIAGAEQTVGCLYLPISEGAVDARYGRVALQLLQDALRRQPLLYSLGMGGFDQPYPKMLRAAGWHLQAVSFHFLVPAPAAFLRNITFLRHRPQMRGALDLLAASGLGSFVFHAAQTLRRCVPAAVGEIKFELVREFSDWADILWRAGCADCQLTAVRNGAALRRLYPAQKEKYLKLKVTRGEKPVGWAVMLNTPMTNHKQFGNLRVGSVIDCFAAPGAEREVVHAATQFLQREGAEIIVTNQSHEHWRLAFDATGFWSGPSNFILAVSRGLTGQIGDGSRLHFTRGDGEGPSHL